jgi:DNA-binding transcriptional regulator YdaS (Cro superfamily)
MTLNDYLAREGAKSLTELSLELGVSKGRLSQLRNLTEWPPELAMKVEQATAGELDASRLSAVVAQARAA